MVYLLAMPASKKEFKSFGYLKTLLVGVMLLDFQQSSSTELDLESNSTVLR